MQLTQTMQSCFNRFGPKMNRCCIIGIKSTHCINWEGETLLYKCRFSHFILFRYWTLQKHILKFPTPYLLRHYLLLDMNTDMKQLCPQLSYNEHGFSFLIVPCIRSYSHKAAILGPQLSHSSFVHGFNIWHLHSGYYKHTSFSTPTSSVIIYPYNSLKHSPGHIYMTLSKLLS